MHFRVLSFELWGGGTLQYHLGILFGDRIRQYYLGILPYDNQGILPGGHPCIYPAGTIYGDALGDISFGDTHEAYSLGILLGIPTWG